MKKKALILAAAVLCLAGCGSNSGATGAAAQSTAAQTTTAAAQSTAAQTTAAAAQSAAAQTTAAAVQDTAAQTTAAAAAQDTAAQGTADGQSAATQPVSGTLTVYTSQPEADIQALVEAYHQVQPDVEVEIFRSGTEEVISKVLAEKQVGSLLADVLLVSDAATFEALKSEDLLLSYASPELDGIDSSYYDADHMYAGTKVITTGIVVNTEVIDGEVTGFADLLKPEFAGELIMPSPLYSGAAAYNLGVLTRTDGLGWEFYTGLKENGVVVGQGNGTVQNAVVAGEQGLGLLVDYMALRAKADGAPVEFVYPSEGSLCITEPIGIVKGTDNEAAAKSFVDFILSEAGQKETAEIGYTPIRRGVDAPEGFRNVDEIESLACDLATLVETRDADKEEFARIFE